MELTQLRYFLSVAKNQHVTKSAEELHVSQPALTQAIHRLEKELEVPLFKTNGRNILLTPCGIYFYEKLNPVMKKLLEFPEELKAMAKIENSTIRLNVLAASTLVTESIIEYQKIDNDVHIKLQQNEENDNYDICITTRLFYQESEIHDDTIFVCKEKIFLAVPNIPKFKGRKTISLKEVQDMGFISLLGSKHLRLICDKYCENAGIKPNIIFESDNPTSVKNMIVANMGIGFWPEFSWGAINTEKLLLLEITSPVCSRDILITCKKNKQDNTHVEAFYKFISKYFEISSKPLK